MTVDSSIVLATYLFKRLEQLGIAHIFGVPGDFNLTLLDHVYLNGKLEWVGFCNELNAAYATDGYARKKGHPGALITTYAVGELSALNGISAACAERVPLIHIVGTTSRPAAEGNWLLHHTKPNANLDPVDHAVFRETAKPYACALEYLENIDTAAEQIDHVISQVCKMSLPGYIYVPTDMVNAKIRHTDRLERPIDTAFQSFAENASTIEDMIADEILSSLYAAEYPILLADIFAERYHLRPEINSVLEKSKIWAFHAPLGKGVIDESSDSYMGCYDGKVGFPGTAETVEDKSDFVLHVGALLSDSNTGGFTNTIDTNKLILLDPAKAVVKGKTYQGINLVPVMKKVAAKFDASKMTFKPTSENRPQVEQLKELDTTTNEITQDQLLTGFSKYCQDDDTVIVECGCFQFEAPHLKLGKRSTYWTQTFYSSIGFALPSAVGAAFAHKELKAPGRVVLIEGDGSALMTLQEIATMIRFKLPIVIFLMNNDGYSIERAIWGPHQGYNDIAGISWTKLLEAFGGSDKDSQSFKATNRTEFSELLELPEIKNPSKVIMAEVFLDKFDYSQTFRKQVPTMQKLNIKAAQEYAKRMKEI